MNKIYKVIWNATLGTWVAVSELAKGKAKSKSSKIQSIVGAVTVALMVTFSSDAMAVYVAGGGTQLTGTGNAGIAIGNGNTGSAVASAAEGIAVGANTAANGDQSTVIGNDINASGTAIQAVVIGSNFNANPTTTTGKGGVSIGSGLTGTLKSPTANGIGSVAIGSSGDGTINSYNGAVATGSYSLALMAGANALGTSSIAIGGGSKALSSNVVAIGTGANASGITSTALGNISNASGARAVAIGDSANASMMDSVAIGFNSNASTGNGAFAVGASSNAIGNNAFAIGTAAKALTRKAVAAGGDSKAGDEYATALGNGAFASSQYSVAIGGSESYETIGYANAVTASGVGAVAIGSNATKGAQASGANSIAIGAESSVAVANAVALGWKASASVANSVALGSNSITSASSGTGYLTSQATPTTGSVSVGNGTTAGNRRIQNLADGSADSDAVTVAQLKNVKGIADTLGANTVAVLGGSATYNSTTGAITNPTYTVNKGTQTTVSGAIAALDAGWKVQTDAGTATAVKAGDTVDIGLSGGESNLTATNSSANGVTTIDFALKKDLTLDSVTAGKSKLDNTGLTITNADPTKTVSVTNAGINAGNQAITNVASAGTLSSTNTNATNGADVFNAVTGLTNAGIKVGASTGTTVTHKLGNELDIVASAKDTTKTYDTSNLTTEVAQDAKSGKTTVTVSMKKDLTLDSVTAGNSKLDNTGLTITNADPTKTVSVTNTGINAGNQAITNVASAGVLSATNTNATNGADVFNAVTGVTNKGINISANGGTADNVKLGETVDYKNTDGNITVATGTDNQIKFDLSKNITVDSVTAGNSKLDNTGLTITNTDPTKTVSVTNTGINAGNQAITNVASAGTLSATNTNATNGADVFNAVTGVTNKGINISANGGTADNVKLGETVDYKNTDGNITVATGTDNQIKFDLAKDITVDSVTAGNSKLDNTGLTITNTDPTKTVSVTNTGINAGNQAITNVASAGTLSATNTNATNGADVFNAVTGVTNKGINISANGGTADNVKLGETVDYKNTDGNITVATGTDNQIKFDLAKNVTVDSVTAGNSKLDNTGLTITNADPTKTVSVTNTGINAGNQAITNVASAGILSATNTNATNGADVFNAVTGVTNKGINISANGGSADNVKLGETVDYKNTDGNITVATGTDNQIKFDLSKNITVDSVTAGNSKLDNTGLTITNADPTKTVSVTNTGINAGNQAITNVASAGILSATNTNATNGADVFNAVTGVTNKGFNISANGANSDNVKLGETVDYKNTDGNITVATGTDNQIKFDLSKNITVDSVTAGNSKLDNTGLTITNADPTKTVSVTNTGINAGNQAITNVASAGILSATNTNATNGADVFNAVTGVTNKGFNISANGANSDNVKLGETVDYKNTDGNITVATGTDNQIKFDLSKNITVDSVTAGNSKLDNTGLTITNTDPTKTVSVTNAGINAGNQAITNVASAGTLSATNTNATNGADVFNAVTGVTNKGFNISANGGAADNVKLGETVDYKNTDGNIIVAAGTDNQIKFDLAKNITVGSVTANDGNGNVTTLTATGTNVTDGKNTANYGADKAEISDGTNTTTTTAGGTTVTDGVNTNTTAADKNTITDGTSTTTVGADTITVGAGSNPVVINGKDGVITGLTNTTIDITNPISGQAATEDQVAQVATDLGNKGFNITANDANSDNVKLGETVDFTNTDGNLVASNKDNQVIYNLSKNITVDSVTANDGNGNVTTLTATGTNVTDGKNTATYGADKAEISDGTNTTTTTAGGTTVTDGVNTNTTAADKNTITDGTSTTTVGADTITVGAGSNPVVINGKDGVITGLTNTTIDITNPTSGQAATEDQVAQVATDLGNKGFNITANGANSDNVKLGETVDFTNTDGNLVASNKDNQVIYNLSKNITVDSVTANDGNGNVTTLTATGTNVTDGKNTANYGADKAEISDGTNTTTTTAGGTTVTDGVNTNTTAADKNTITDGTSTTTVGADTITVGAGSNPVVINGKDGVITGLTNTTIDITNPTSGQAATEDQVAQVATDLGNKGFNITANGANSDNVKLGETVDFTNTDGNLVASNKDNQVIYNLSKNITVDSVTANDGNGNVTTLTATGTNVTDGKNTANYGADKAEISDGTNTTTTTAGGTTVTDGVNTNTTAADKNTITDGTSTTTVGADTITVGAGSNPVVINGKDGVITGLTNTTIDITNPTSGQAATEDQVAQVATDLGNKGFNITANGANSDNVKLGETVDFTNTDGNLVASNKDNQVIYNLSKNITVDSVTANDGNGNVTTLTATGTNVTDGKNTANYGADKAEISDGTNTTTWVRTRLPWVQVQTQW